MSRYHEADIKDAIKTKLDSDFNTMITTIRTERSDTTIPLAKNITFDLLKNQYPEIYIDITGSELLNDEELSDNIEIVTESFEVEVSAIIKTNSTSLSKYGDYYNEAFKRVLQGYNDANIRWIGVINTVQEDRIQENTHQTYKLCGVVLQVLVP